MSNNFLGIEFYIDIFPSAFESIVSLPFDICYWWGVSIMCQSVIRLEIHTFFLSNSLKIFFVFLFVLVCDIYSFTTVLFGIQDASRFSGFLIDINSEKFSVIISEYCLFPVLFIRCISALVMSLNLVFISHVSLFLWSIFFLVSSYPFHS